MLNGREPKVVNGPEVLNKYVGASEENIRKLFVVGALLTSFRIVDRVGVCVRHSAFATCVTHFAGA